MNPMFWDRLWRSAGIQFVLLFVIAYFIYGDQPKVGSSTDALISLYDGNRTRILIAAFLLGMALLNLLWFAAAIRSELRDGAQDGWGAAVTASSAALGAVLFVTVTLGAALAYRIAGGGNPTFASGLNDVVWACLVMSSFPRAMLIMAGSFGLWREKAISNAFFGACVAAVVLVLLGGTTWMSSGIWAPDGVYSRLISPAIGLIWVVLISGVLLKRPATTRLPAGAAVPQW